MRESWEFDMVNIFVPSIRQSKKKTKPYPKHIKPGGLRPVSYNKKPASWFRTLFTEQFVVHGKEPDNKWFVEQGRKHASSESTL
jgi:hypothetical protein